MILRSSLIALAFFGIAAAAAPGDAPLRAMHWLAPDADVVRAMTTEPVECLRRAPDEAGMWRIETGRAAFRSPLTLGGQAARAGVSCETCHRNGHTNPDFLFPGVSGAPGTADVTSSLFSSHRGDGTDNPRPIPDLAGPRAALRISRAPDDPALRDFIHGLVTQEFDGVEPSQAVLDGLVAYVRALEPGACGRQRVLRRTLDEDLDATMRAVRAGAHALAIGDLDTARAMFAAAQGELGRAGERYDMPALQGLHSELRQQALALETIRNNLQANGSGARLLAWERAQHALEERLRAREARSLYNPAVLGRAIAQYAAGR